MAVLAATTLWGTSGTAQQMGGLSGEPAAAGAARLLVGAVVLVTLCFVSRRSHELRAMFASRARWWAIAAAGATAVYQATFFTAVARTGVAVGTVVALASAPIFCGLLAGWLVGEGRPPGWTIAAACAVIGCALLLLPDSDTKVDALGVAFALVAGGCYGLYTVAAKRLLRAGTDALVVIGTTLSAGAILLAPVLVVEGLPASDARAVAAVLWLGVVATAAAYLLFVRGLARVPATNVGILALGEPLTAALLGVTLLSERASPPVAAGAVLLLASLTIAAVRPRRTSGRDLDRP